jgi:hypothetical protein
VTVPIQKPPVGTPIEAVTSTEALYQERGRIIARHRAWLEKELASREMWAGGLHARSQPARGMMDLEARVLKEALENLGQIEAISKP